MTQASHDAVGNIPPDRVRLTLTQARRFSELTGIAVDEINGRTISELSEQLKWSVDPQFFLFRRICGQVVKKDPATGDLLPVPFATVCVYDTECDFLGLFPRELPWVWCYPIFCHEEKIACVRTDQCGKFCVWIPWFEIEWVIRWRAERFCYNEIFVKPTLQNVLQTLGGLPVNPNPPDPAPFVLADGGLTYNRIASIAGQHTALKLASAERAAMAGGSTAEFTALLKGPGFSSPVPPPATAQLRALANTYKREGHSSIASFVRSSHNRAFQLNLNHYIGPFFRQNCEWRLVEELVPILEVPDVTFRVTQDINGDGEQEVIYTDGWFDVPWQTRNLSNVTLYASANARATTSCQVPVFGDCGEPAILFAGLMPANSGYIDFVTGYGIRPNPAHADALIRPSVFPPASPHDTPSTAPFEGTVQLYGCNQYPGGAYYRLLYSFNGAPAVPFTNLDWYLDPFPGPGAPLHVVPDAQGYYPILADPKDWFPDYELLDWPTTQFVPGLYSVTMEIADAARTTLFTTAAVPFLVDNTAPSLQWLSLAWRVAGSSSWIYFSNLICPIIDRPSVGGTPDDIEFRVEYLASAPHLLAVTLRGAGCGAGAPVEEAPPNWSDPPTPAFVPAVPPPTPVSQDPANHWYTDATDNTVHRSAVFFLPGSAPAGAYGFSLAATTRAFNPAGGDGSNPQAHDWYVDTQSLIESTAFLPVAVFDV
jgi:hypothetical protein